VLDIAKNVAPESIHFESSLFFRQPQFEAAKAIRLTSTKSLIGFNYSIVISIHFGLSKQGRPQEIKPPGNRSSPTPPDHFRL
jgi:hypothetical protein